MKPVYLLFIMLISAAAAQPILHLKYDGNIRTAVTSDSALHSIAFYGGVPDGDYSMYSLRDRTGTEIARGMMYAGTGTKLALPSGVASIMISSPSFSHEENISFCDFDGICEPCDSCALRENSASCTDCPSGSKDSYCDFVEDGICDPDCSERDADCAGCKGTCLYADSRLPLTKCTDVGGSPCEAGERCSGRWEYADDTGTRCCIGICLRGCGDGYCEKGEVCPSDCWNEADTCTDCTCSGGRCGEEIAEVLIIEEEEDKPVRSGGVDYRILLLGTVGMLMLVFLMTRLRKEDA